MGDFFGKSDFLFTRSQSGFILDEERMVEVSVWLEATWDDRTKVRKLVAFYELFCITTLIGIFWLFFGDLGPLTDVSRLGFVDSYEKSRVVVMAWLEVALYG